MKNKKRYETPTMTIVQLKSQQPLLQASEPIQQQADQLNDESPFTWGDPDEDL